MNGFHQAIDLDLQLVTDDAQSRRIDRDSFHFHGDKHRQQGPFDGMKDCFLAGFTEQGPKFLRELIGDVRILGGIFSQSRERDRGDVEVFGGFGFFSKREEIVRWSLRGGRGNFSEFDRRVAKQDFRQIVHRVTTLGSDQSVSQ